MTTKTEAAKPNPCRCVCGQPTITDQARYIAGHDARHAGNLARAVLAEQDGRKRAAIRRAITKQLSPALQAKA